MHEEFPISHLIYLFISPPFTYLGKHHKAHQYPLQGLIKLVGMSMVLELVRDYHFCSYCLFLQFIHSSSSLMCSQLFLLLNFESPYLRKTSLISRKSFNLVLAFLIIWRFLHFHESYFVWKKNVFFHFSLRLIQQSEILKLHHSLHKTNHLFYIMRFTSSFSLCHLEFHKNMLKPRSIGVTSFDFLH